MGMFSWCCKGCGEEICRGEFARLNGRKQVYGGYGDGDHDEYVAWHQRCYGAATKEQKLDDNPSKPAKNQGMGAARLRFLEGYDEGKPVTYTAVLYAYGEKGQFEFFYTNSGKLENQTSYDALYEAEADKPSGFDYEAWTLLPAEDKKKAKEEHLKKIEEAIGFPSPRDNAKVFGSRCDALVLALAALDRAALARDLPEECGGRYHLIVLGRQGEIEGSVYERVSRSATDRNPTTVT